MEGRLAVGICKSAKHSSSSTVLFISVPVVAHHSISINSPFFVFAEGTPHSCTSLCEVKSIVIGLVTTIAVFTFKVMTNNILTQILS